MSEKFDHKSLHGINPQAKAVALIKVSAAVTATCLHGKHACGCKQSMYTLIF